MKESLCALYSRKRAECCEFHYRQVEANCSLMEESWPNTSAEYCMVMRVLKMCRETQEPLLGLKYGDTFFKR